VSSEPKHKATGFLGILKIQEEKIMDTRRPTNSTAKPFTRKTYYKKDGERTFGERNQQSRDNRFQSRDNRFQDKDERFQNRSGNFFSKNDRFHSNRRFPPKGKNFKPWEKINKTRITSDMQITDGKHRGKHLTSTTSPKVRPTSRRIRETMFKILFRRVRAGRFLDLCAGSGMVGIEAISRGALIGTFVERSAKMSSYIKKNLEACGIKDGHGEIVEMEVIPFLKKMSKRRRFWDVVYFDPPYDSNYEEALKYFARGATIKPHGVLVIEHHSEMFFPEKIGVLKRWRVIINGDSAISFYERK
jgi:16S rRNA (guanine966-N2)-methyltransferase